jgi:hypothetical protein
MKKVQSKRTYVGEILSVLAYEFDPSEHIESERKIRRRLRDKKLGTYDQGRIDLIRAFKDDVRRELNKPLQSAFYKTTRGVYADPRDWDFGQLAAAMKRRHPKLPARDIGGFLPYALYLYYLR